MAMTDVAPPAYTSNVPPEACPSAVSLPATLRVGGRMVKNTSVNIEDVKSHLGLLRAFWNLRQTVEKGLDTRFTSYARTMHPDQRWAWFITLAVERFERWSQVVIARIDVKDWIADEIPPLDVFMIWHAYLLNPQRYAEDCDRVLPKLEALSPAMMLAALGRVPDISTFVPSEARRQLWLAKTQTPFDPFESLQIMVTQELRCPQCIATLCVPYFTEDGKGYAQQGFSTICTACRFEITKEALAVANFTATLVRSYTISRSAAFLPGTVRTSEAAQDDRRACHIKSMILMAGPFTLKKGVRPTPVEMGNNVKWSMNNIRKTPGLLVKPRMVNRILSSYSDQRPFSVELVGAVLRQATFVKKMHELGWTKPGYFDDRENSVAIVHAVVRYHAFLDLMSSSTTSFFVPTLDIDLVWHTHQLLGAHYQRDCKQYVGRYIDHDDKVEETHLANAFDLTCRAWNIRFNVPYMHCGCPLPGDTVGQKLSRLVARLGLKYDAPLAPPEHPDILAASHPSDHSSVKVPDLPHLAARTHARDAKMRRRRERDAERVQQGRMSREAYERGQAHEPAFLVPVPIYWGGAMGACAVGTGSIVSAGGCGGFSGCAAGSGAACGGGGGASEGCGGGAGGGCGGGAGGGCGGGASGGCGGGGGGGCGGGGGGGGGCGGG